MIHTTYIIRLQQPKVTARPAASLLANATVVASTIVSWKVSVDYFSPRLRLSIAVTIALTRRGERGGQRGSAT